MLEQLWAGWRSSYVESFSDARALDGTPQCVFCGIVSSSAPDQDRLVLFSGDETAAIMNAYPYAPGHLMVMPQRHVRELEDLSPSEAAELWETVLAAVAAVKAAYRPDGLNVGLNLGRAAGAGIPTHLHVHVVPRWLGDTNFMTSVASVRVLPESLDASWAKLRAVWQ